MTALHQAQSTHLNGGKKLAPPSCQDWALPPQMGWHRCLCHDAAGEGPVSAIVLTIYIVAFSILARDGLAACNLCSAGS